MRQLWLSRCILHLDQLVINSDQVHYSPRIPMPDQRASDSAPTSYQSTAQDPPPVRMGQRRLADSVPEARSFNCWTCGASGHKAGDCSQRYDRQQATDSQLRRATTSLHQQVETQRKHCCNAPTGTWSSHIGFVRVTCSSRRPLMAYTVLTVESWMFSSANHGVLYWRDCRSSVECVRRGLFSNTRANMFCALCSLAMDDLGAPNNTELQ